MLQSNTRYIFYILDQKTDASESDSYYSMAAGIGIILF